MISRILESLLGPVGNVNMCNVGVLCAKRALNPVRFPGTVFMQTTARTRFKLKRMLLLMTGVAICTLPVREKASEWCTAFARDHEAEFLLRGVTQGFSCKFADPYRRGSHISDEHGL